MSALNASARDGAGEQESPIDTTRTSGEAGAAARPLVAQHEGDTAITIPSSVSGEATGRNADPGRPNRGDDGEHKGTPSTAMPSDANRDGQSLEETDSDAHAGNGVSPNVLVASEQDQTGTKPRSASTNERAAVLPGAVAVGGDGQQNEARSAFQKNVEGNHRINETGSTNNKIFASLTVQPGAVAMEGESSNEAIKGSEMATSIDAACESSSMTEPKVSASTVANGQGTPDEDKTTPETAHKGLDTDEDNPSKPKGLKENANKEWPGDSATVAIFPTVLNASVSKQPDDLVDQSGAEQAEEEEASHTLTESLSTPMIQAELVTPPVEAYQVAIDEDLSLMGAVRPEMENMAIDRGHQADENRGLNWRPRAFLTGVCLCLTIAAIVVPLIVVDRQTPELKETERRVPTSAPSSSPSLSPTFPYKCYTSTEDILESQRNDEDIPAVYIICPDTDITIGSFRDPNGEDFSFVGGDYPIMAIRENVVIQCGLDGSIENNCTVRDGFIQVLTGQEVPTNDGGFTISDPIDNFTLRGIRFTGIPVNSGPFVGNSVTLSHPGSNIRFEDCMWIDFSTSGSLVSISRNEFLEILDLPVEDGSISVTFTNCRFERIIFDGPLIYVNGQNLSLEDSSFRIISVSVLSQDVFSAFLICEGASTCYASDLCLDDIEHSSQSFITLTQDVTDFAFERLYWENILLQDSECELGIFPSQEQGTSLSPLNCSSVFISDACPEYFSL